MFSDSAPKIAEKVNLLSINQKKLRAMEFQKKERLKILDAKRKLFLRENEPSEYSKDEEIKEDDFHEEFSNVLKNPDYERIFSFIRKLQAKTSERQFPLERFLESDQLMIRIIIDLLSRDDAPIIQYYVCWILSNLLAADTSIPFDKILYENGAFDHLLKMMTTNNNKSDDLYIQIIWVLGNFFASEKIPFDEINSQLYPLCKIILSKINKDCEEMSIWTISNMLKGKYPVKDSEFNDILEVLLKILYRNEIESVNVALDIYSVISKYIFEYKSTLEILMNSNNHKFFYFILDKLNIPVTSKKDIIMKCFICEILEILSQQVIIYESIWIQKPVVDTLLSNINEKTNSSTTQKLFWIVFNLFNSGVFLELFLKLTIHHKNIMLFVFNQSEFAYEALRIFVAIIRRANYSQLITLENDSHIIELFIFAINMIREAKFLKLALEGIYDIFQVESLENGNRRNFVLKFEALNGDNILLELQHFNDETVYTLVSMILDEFIQKDQN